MATGTCITSTQKVGRKGVHSREHLIKASPVEPRRLSTNSHVNAPNQQQITRQD
ncbi:hypothetical protein E2C01_053936 [Portunus trituberculatus]|uniref:Uncharacterized protein n=1 Tax=Portunus trituberculatus TaxID=210409 RepID=A0A5B7GRU1_PORTR|nr:hypothetical protein [Portunus trituberculatus]